MKLSTELREAASAMGGGLRYVDYLQMADKAQVLEKRVAELDRPALAEVAKERKRQDEKWGQQDHPDFYPYDWCTRDCAYEVPTAKEARQACEEAFAEGHGDYFRILLEEVCEAMEAPDTAELRAELIQVAAVAVQWVEAIDRRSK